MYSACDFLTVSSARTSNNKAVISSYTKFSKGSLNPSMELVSFLYRLVIMVMA